MIIIMIIIQGRGWKACTPVQLYIHNNTQTKLATLIKYVYLHDLFDMQAFSACTVKVATYIGHSTNKYLKQSH